MGSQFQQAAHPSRRLLARTRLTLRGLRSFFKRVRGMFATSCEDATGQAEWSEAAAGHGLDVADREAGAPVTPSPVLPVPRHSSEQGRLARQRYERVCADMAKVWASPIIQRATVGKAVQRGRRVLESSGAQELADYILEVAGPICSGKDEAYTKIARGSSELTRYALAALLGPMVERRRLLAVAVTPQQIMQEVMHWVEFGHSNLFSAMVEEGHIRPQPDPAAQISDLLALQVQVGDAAGIRLAVLAVTAAPLQAMICMLGPQAACDSSTS